MTVMQDYTGKKSRITSSLYRKRSSQYRTDEFLDRISDRDLLMHMGVPAMNVDAALDVYEHWSFPSTLDVWFEKLTDEIFRPQFGCGYDFRLMSLGLAIYGPTGSGKTTLAAAILLRVIRRRIENIDPISHDKTWAGAAMGRFVDWQEAVKVFRMASAPDAEGWVREANADLRDAMRPTGAGDNRLVRGDFLVIDDITRERPTEFVRDELHSILRMRHNWGWPTIVTMNNGPKAWPDIYGDVIGVYMQRCFLPIPFTS